MSKKILITSDSTCDLSKELIDLYKIKINPLNIVIDGNSYEDSINVTPEDVFKYYETTGKLAKTTAANMADYMSFFKPLVDEGYCVIHFCMSALMSSSYNNAKMASAEFEDVHVIDSRNLSTGIGLSVIKACELRDKGLPAEEIVAQINEYVTRVDASYIVDTLTFLYKGGRCSGLAALGANLLKLKPCIEVKDGNNIVGRKYRGKLPDILLEYVENRLENNDIDTERVFITHTGCSRELVDSVKEKVKSIVDFKEVLETIAGCSVSVHCGRNTLGVLFVHKK